ncbi:MAG: prefoldin subunit [Candidatus Pacearchaeota archaeon]|nr:prefoldin subunit [Candidatus Pacearchaeota archaeon]
MVKAKHEERGRAREDGKKDIVSQLQITEQALQNLLLQKQLFQLEFVETNSALEELKKTKTEDVYKIVGSLMFKSDKIELEKELERKRDILDLRLKTIEKQEEELKEKLLKNREMFLKEIKK